MTDIQTRNLDKVTWVSDERGRPDSQIDCQGCDAVIIFSSEEILTNKAKGLKTSTPCCFCGWHPPYPPEPWRPYPAEGQVDFWKATA